MSELEVASTEVTSGVEVGDLVVSEGLGSIHAMQQEDIKPALAGQQVVVADSGSSGVIKADHTTLQSLLNTVAATNTSTGDTIRVIQVGSDIDASFMNRVWQVLPDGGTGDMPTIIAVSQNGEDAVQAGVVQAGSSDGHCEIQTVSLADAALLSRPPVPPPPRKEPPPGCPPWATRLNDCEAMGDSYRGWVESEVELDLLLTYHKQQTMSFWGTRQSPSGPVATRLMWKSQYVPFDGVPFINLGSRAIVMECQFGPRRKGRNNKGGPLESPAKWGFKQTCPARIYIKKVKKFPEFAVNLGDDKKLQKQVMDKTFQDMKTRNLDSIGHERWYVQLPTESAHEFHNEKPQPIVEETPESAFARLHPRVAAKIRDIVAAGETKVYAVRKQLRNFIHRELFQNNPEQMPERHNLSYFPTVHDLQNHIHQAIKDIEAGVLPALQTVNVEVVTTNQANTSQGQQSELQTIELGTWQPSQSDEPHAETVTVTLTQNPGEDGQHIISRVETHMSDGSTQISNTLTPDTAQLLAKLHPSMFPSGSMIQVQEVPVSQAQPDSFNLDNQDNSQNLVLDSTGTSAPSQQMSYEIIENDTAAEQTQYFVAGDDPNQLSVSTVDQSALVDDSAATLGEQSLSTSQLGDIGSTDASSSLVLDTQ